MGLVPNPDCDIPREALDETVLRVHEVLNERASCSACSRSPKQLPFCAFNSERDVWIDVGNKRVGVDILGSYLGIDYRETIHVGDQFLNTGNDFAARSVCPCIWITNPDETTYILKSILRSIPSRMMMPMMWQGKGTTMMIIIMMGSVRVRRWRERQLI